MANCFNCGVIITIVQHIVNSSGTLESGERLLPFRLLVEWLIIKCQTVWHFKIHIVNPSTKCNP